MAGACPTPTALDAETLATLQAALSASTDLNPYVRDIKLSGEACTASPESVGAQVPVAGECFEHVHPDLYSVRDFSRWVARHNGNGAAAAAGRPNPIAKWADQGLPYLSFPGNHALSRWYDNQEHIPIVGRYGDTVDFMELRTELQTSALAVQVGARVRPDADAFEACGSPGEARNEPLYGHRYPMADIQSAQRLFNEHSVDHWKLQPTDSKQVVWATVVLSAPDQLRQRVAWGLSQLMIISREGLGRATEAETWATYYDIFVRNAFGNYRDVLREVAYSPMMGVYLTYRQNKAFAALKTYPDENFAREVMQLFTIGLWRLAEDGTRLRDARGDPVATYGNDDVVAFARVWTGFDYQSWRGNVEAEDGYTSRNLIDPMQIKAGWRDRLPKTRLDAGYLGDGFPLCHKLPPQPFLREGARFTYTGASSIEGPTIDGMTGLPHEAFEAEDAAVVSPGARVLWRRVELPNPTGDYVEWHVTRARPETVALRAYYRSAARCDLELRVNNQTAEAAWAFPATFSIWVSEPTRPVQVNLTQGLNTIRLTTTGAGGAILDFITFGGDGAFRRRFEPDPSTSRLHAALCAPAAAGGPCTFPANVTLSQNLPCHAAECSAGRVTVVSVHDPVAGVRRYYSHAPRPCVRLALFTDGRITKWSKTKGQCTAAEAPAGPACCVPGKSTVLPFDPVQRDTECLFGNEALGYAAAAGRCAARGGAPCPDWNSGTTFLNTCAAGVFVWTAARCAPQIQIYPDRSIGLIDPVATDDKFWPLRPNSDNVFRVRWESDSAVPSGATGCGAGCAVQAAPLGRTCLCNVTVVETVCFADPSAPPTGAAVAAALFIGSLAPTAHGARYVACAAPCAADVRVWTLASDPSRWDRDTVFELPPRVPGGRRRYLLNRASRVHVAGQPAAAFRNPPHFLPLLGEQTLGSQAYSSTDLLGPQAEYEVEALLDHLFEHPNAPPFVSRRLIQQMVTSNPSPAYVRRVAAAFRTGRRGGIGTGRYGDMAAVVAAVLLDQEARTEVLDADPTFGRRHEPIAQVLPALCV